jgi:hypothetical protein
MATYYSPKIVTDGLVCYFDIANSKSYLGSGTSLVDLSENKFSATLTNGPTFNAGNCGYLTMDGTNDYILTGNLASPLGLSSIESHFTWVYPTAAGQIVSELGQGTSDTGWHDSNIEISSGGVFSFSTWHGSLTNRVSSTAKSFNAWYHNTTLTAYINGLSIGTTTFTRTPPYTYGTPGSYGLYYGLFSQDGTNMGTYAYAAGRFGSFMVYNKSLTANEVMQNYNATKARFGL